MKRIPYEEFEKNFEQLVDVNPHYAPILFETMRRLAKDCSIPAESHFKENFQKYKKKHSITYEEIACQLSKRFEMHVDVNTIKSYGRKERKNLSTSYSKEIAEILGVTEDMLIYGIDRITIKLSMNTDIHDMFNRLSQQNQNAILYLVSSLYMEITTPELFNNEIFEEQAIKNEIQRTQEKETLKR